MGDPSAVRRHWALTYFFFLVGRGPAECLWVVSLTPTYSAKLADHAGTAGLVVYHTLAVFFTCLNLRILGLFWCWHSQDLEKAISTTRTACEPGDGLKSGTLNQTIGTATSTTSKPAAPESE